MCLPLEKRIVLLLQWDAGTSPRAVELAFQIAATQASGVGGADVPFGIGAIWARSRFSPHL
jgi:hypothetical protein